MGNVTALQQRYSRPLQTAVLLDLDVRLLETDPVAEQRSARDKLEVLLCGGNEPPQWLQRGGVQASNQYVTPAKHYKMSIFIVC